MRIFFNRIKNKNRFNRFFPPVSNNRYAIEYISNPSEKIQLAAVARGKEAIEFIKNPTEKVLRAAGL
jgi:hypothetical protein